MDKKNSKQQLEVIQDWDNVVLLGATKMDILLQDNGLYLSSNGLHWRSSCRLKQVVYLPQMKWFYLNYSIFQICKWDDTKVDGTFSDCSA